MHIFLYPSKNIAFKIRTACGNLQFVLLFSNRYIFMIKVTFCFLEQRNNDSNKVRHVTNQARAFFNQRLHMLVLSVDVYKNSQLVGTYITLVTPVRFQLYDDLKKWFCIEKWG